MEHSKLPWKVASEMDDEPSLITTDAGVNVAECWTKAHAAIHDPESDEDWYADDETVRANAEFIVLACNNHDKLLAALELANDMLGRFANGEKPYQTDEEGEEIFATICAAIVAAGG